MICKYCGQHLTLTQDGEYWAIKYQGGEGLIDETTRMCQIPIDRGSWPKYEGTYVLIPHEPCKNSIVKEIIKDLI